jgi:uncharacterized protein YwqG
LPIYPNNILSFFVENEFFHSLPLGVIVKKHYTMNEIIKNKILDSEYPQDIKHQIISGLTDRYTIEPYKSLINIGDSKVGGFPHLPNDIEYPQEENYYYEFVAQINLNDLVDNEIADFPQEGILYFFIDDDFNVGNVNCKIVHLDTDKTKLVIKRPPEGKKSRCESFDGRTEKTEMKLKIDKSITIPQGLLSDILNNSLSDKINTTKFDIESFYTQDQIWGYPANWRIENAQWWAYLTKKRFSSLYYLTLNGQTEHLEKEKIDFLSWVNERVDALILKQQEILKKHNDKSAYIYPYWERELADLEFTKNHLASFIPELKQHKVESEKWKQLLSISSYYDANIRFGDGKMEFFINSEDLKHKKFDNTFCHIYG